jgi:hypothetical protein
MVPSTLRTLKGRGYDTVSQGGAFLAPHVKAQLRASSSASAARLEAAFAPGNRLEIVLNPLLSGCHAERDSDTLRFSWCVGQPRHKDARWRQVIASVVMLPRFRLFVAHAFLYLRPEDFESLGYYWIV